MIAGVHQPVHRDHHYDRRLRPRELRRRRAQTGGGQPEGRVPHLSTILTRKRSPRNGHRIQLKSRRKSIR